MAITRPSGLVGLVVAALLASGCSAAAEPAAPTRTTSPVTVAADALTLVEMSSVRDWVTYADKVVLVRVISEQRLKPSEDEVAAGEGYLPRQITVQIVRTLWAQPSATRDLPQTVSWLQGAWLFGKGEPERRLVSDADGAWGEVGRDYVAALAFSGFGPTESALKAKFWGSLTMIPAQDGVVGRGEKGVASAPAGSLRASADGLSVDALAGLLTAAQPYPAAQKVIDEDLSVRAAAVHGG